MAANATWLLTRNGRNDLSADDVVGPMQPDAALTEIAPGDDDAEIVLRYDDQQLSAVAVGLIARNACLAHANAHPVPAIAVGPAEIGIGKGLGVAARCLFVDRLQR